MARKVEDALFNFCKERLIKKDADSGVTGQKIHETMRSSLLTSFYAAKRNGFELKNLTDEELSFLYEFVST